MIPNKSIMTSYIKSPYKFQACSYFCDIGYNNILYKICCKNVLSIHEYTLNKSSKWYIVYICRVCQTCLGADKFYTYFD